MGTSSLTLSASPMVDTLRPDTLIPIKLLVRTFISGTAPKPGLASTQQLRVVSKSLEANCVTNKGNFSVFLVAAFVAEDEEEDGTAKSFK